jgi:excisionase family DNA binding protein
MSDVDVTLQEAAASLGVHYMTVYRYVRLGLLPARKDGATWRVARADLDELRAASPVPAAPGRRRAPWAERLETRLLAGDGRGAWAVIEAALAAGSQLDSLYLDVLAPAMRSIGDRWERGEVDVALEHRASGIALRIVGRIGPRFVRRGRTRGCVVLGAPAGDHHALPPALVADLLRSAGWEVHDLGGDVPSADFAEVARAVPRLAAVGVSVTADECLGAAGETLEVLRDSLAPTVAILVGGRAVGGEAEARSLGADGWAADGRGARALLDRSSPSPPPARSTAQLRP